MIAMNTRVKKQVLVAAVVSGVLGAGVTGTAHAMAYSYAIVDWESFTASFTGTGTTTSSSLSSLGDADSSGFPRSSFGAGGAGILNPPQLTSGSGPFPGEDFYAPFFAADNGVRTDAVLTLTTSPAGTSISATGKNVAEGRRTTEGTGATGFTNIWEWVFTPDASGTFSFSGTGTPSAHVELDATGVFARAGIELELLLFDNTTGSTVFDIFPVGNLNIILDQTTVGFTDLPGAGNGAPVSFSGSGAVVAGHEYLFFVAQEEIVPIIENGPQAPIPEPATVLLMTLGLGGLGFVSRRKRH